jgi:iron complex transport system permease protein
MKVRLPRIMMAALLGMALSTSGAALQSAFRNPLVGPGILGVTQGAAFGAAFSILFLSNYPLVVEVSATLFALLALIMAYSMSRAVRYGESTLKLILGGMVVSALFSGGIGVMKSMADPLKQLPELTFWMLGGLSGTVWRDFYFALPPAMSGIIILFLMRWRLNLLTLDNEVALSLGVDPGRLRALTVLAAVVSIAVVTSVSGPIGWMGLIVPHIVRKLFGIDNRRVITASALMGASLMVVFPCEFSIQRLPGHPEGGLYRSSRGEGNRPAWAERFREDHTLQGVAEPNHPSKRRYIPQ